MLKKLHKKGITGLPGFLGALQFVFVILVIALVFLGCSIENTKDTVQERNFQSWHYDAIQSLNIFLESETDDGTTGAESLQKAIITNQFDTINANIKNHLNQRFENWQFTIRDQEGYLTEQIRGVWSPNNNVIKTTVPFPVAVDGDVQTHLLVLEVSRLNIHGSTVQ